MGTTTSGETIFTFTTDRIIVIIGQPKLITASDYSKQVILKGRPVLPIEYLVTKNSIGDVIFTIIMGNSTSNKIEIIIKVQKEVITIEKGNDIPGISITFVNNINTLIKISKGSPFVKCTYKIGDEYLLKIAIPDTPKTANFGVEFSRSNHVDEDDKCIFPTVLDNNIYIKTIVPSIDINFQSLIDGSDIGNTVFTIVDNVQYYNHKTTPIIYNHICKITTTDNPKTTIFNKSCPLIVNVLRGIGTNAYEKIIYLIQNIETGQSDVYDFALLLVKYSMLKYILSRLMYGDFNVKYVLNKYNNKFLKDLSNTRFCKFVNEFTNPNSDIFGYDKYFL